jgi:hypothetical protein
VASQQDLEEIVDYQTTERDIPYVISRGDGSTGGGGVPMPHASTEEDEMDLRRPKVNAEMPEG